LIRIAEDHGVTPAQVVLRWHVEHEVVAIPKSQRPERIRQNIDIFDFRLAPDEVRLIDAMGGNPPS
jgi:diketogulonate reductase-like aldo/keto reductase